MRTERNPATNQVGEPIGVVEIRRLLVRMFDVVDEQLADSLNVMQRSDARLAKLVRRRDDELDRLEMDIDRVAFDVLLGRPEEPRVTRFVISSVKVSTDLERIGDHCKNIAKSTGLLPAAALSGHMKYFDSMIVSARSMLFAAQDALLYGDLEKAWELVMDGHSVSRLHSETLDSIMASNPRDSFKSGARIYALSKALERIADHSVNIAESVLFWTEGIDVRHHRGPDSLRERNIKNIGRGRNEQIA